MPELACNQSETSITTTSTQEQSTSAAEFDRLAQAHLDGFATDEEVSFLETNEEGWIASLWRLLREAEDALEDVSGTVKGPERATVLADFEDDCDRIEDLIADLLGLPEPAPEPERRPQRSRVEVVEEPPANLPQFVQLQLSWTPGRLIAWAAGHDTDSDSTDEVQLRLQAAGATGIAWEKHRRQIDLPGRKRADAVSAPIEDTLGWLVSLATLSADEATGTSVSWLGHTAALAVRLAADGRMVPQLKKARKARSDAAPKGDRSNYEVRWVPALMDSDEITQLAESLPGAVAAFASRKDARSIVQSLVGDLLDAIVRNAASKLEVPAAPPEPTSKSDVAEAFLAHLGDGTFEAPVRAASDVSRRLDQWSRGISGVNKFSLIIQLDPPDDDNAWYAAVYAPGANGALEPAETAMVNSSNTRGREVKDQMARIERIFPELMRPGAKRRGEVVLSQDEAWRLMTEGGDVLRAAGFEVRVPALSRRKASASLRLTAEDATESVAGAQQLANVRWSAVFDEVELTADEIARLAKEARPLVRSRGQWIELSHADLAEAAKALAERADKTQLTGADMLRHALGLEGESTLAGGISIAGDGWAADLLRSARDIPEDLPTTFDVFKGELRSYQAEARAWLTFLDNAGLGGCLALDMGLGKTPTMLAHLALTKDSGPALVIAPPAVVGNWAAEARKFVPTMRVVVHHGSSRTSAAGLPAVVGKADIVITTYGTAVRDVDALEKIEWGKTVLDEAQVIKNPTSETAQQLRRIPSRTRVALTGTPIENGLGDLWAILDYTNPGLVGSRAQFVTQLSVKNGPATGKEAGESALRALNGILVFRRTKAEPAIAAELPDRIDELDLCSMTPEQIGLYQAVLDKLVIDTADDGSPQKKGAVLAAITALKQICNHPANYQADEDEGVSNLEGRSGKLARLNEIVDSVFAADERMLIFTHFASWGEKLAEYLTERTGVQIACYHGGLARGARDRLVDEFQAGTGKGAMVLSLKAGGTGLNLTAASHVVLYDRWWNPAVEDQARDRVWRIGQKNTVICHRLVCPGTIDERVEEVVAGKRQIADMVLPKSSSVGDLDAEQLQVALGIDSEQLLVLEVEDEKSAESAAGEEVDASSGESHLAEVGA